MGDMGRELREMHRSTPNFQLPRLKASKRLFPGHSWSSLCMMAALQKWRKFQSGPGSVSMGRENRGRTSKWENCPVTQKHINWAINGNITHCFELQSTGRVLESFQCYLVGSKVTDHALKISEINGGEPNQTTGAKSFKSVQIQFKLNKFPL